MITIPVINGSPQTPIPEPNFGVGCNGVNFLVAENEQDAIDLAAMFAPTDAQKLSAAKLKKITDINTKSGYLIMVIGYAFDGFQFPFDTYAQTNFAGLSGEVQSGVITALDFPKDIYRYNNTGETGDNYYSLSLLQLGNIRRAQYERVNAVRNGGIDLIQQVNACTTVAQVDAIVDART